MKEFIKSNTVTYNLMSFTGFKSMLIFSLLSDSPKSYKELQKALEEHAYLHEKVSVDTIRIYINSLKKIGCKITRKNIDGISKYHIDSHPFELRITDSQAESILKIYRVICKSVEISELIYLQQFFEKFSKYISNEDLKNKIRNISPISNINPIIIKDLINYAQNNTEITILYNSPSSGKKNINIVVDKLSIVNNKLYVYGTNSEYDNYSSFLVSKIIKILSINLYSTNLNSQPLTVGYELQNKETEIELLNCEKIIKADKNKTLIEITSKNKFDIIQRILSHTNQCKVIYPESFRTSVISTLKTMKEGYLEE